MRKKALLFIGILGMTFSLFAQTEKLNEEKRKDFEAQKIAFFTQVMDLTPEEAAKFWPLYNEMQKKIREEGGKMRNIMKSSSLEEVSEKQAKDNITVMLETELNVQMLKKEYYQKIMKELSAKKLWQMLKAERDFQRQLWKRFVKYPPKH